MENTKIQRIRVWLALEAVSIGIIIFSNNIYLSGFGVALALISIYFLLVYVYFRKGKFDADSLYICLSYSIPMLLLIFISFYLSNTKKFQKDLKGYTSFAININLFFFLYFGFVYFQRCLKAIREIMEDEHLLIAEIFKSTLKSLLIFAAANLAILSFSKKQGYMLLTYQLCNVFINCMLLFIDIFIYVHSKIDEFDKQEKNEIEKNKIEKKQFNDVEQFINNCTNSDDLDDLDDLEKNINKKRKKLEKGKFAGVKKIVKICNRRSAKINAKIYIKKFATLEDLDNLEKIIVKKRDDLEKNNDIEKRMD